VVVIGHGLPAAAASVIFHLFVFLIRHCRFALFTQSTADGHMRDIRASTDNERH